eukprot:9314061-Alexandrium_andersonii.AAC.1
MPRPPASDAGQSAAADPWGPSAWAAAQGPLLPPDDLRVSMAAALQTRALGVDVTAAGVAGRAAADAG